MAGAKFIHAGMVDDHIPSPNEQVGLIGYPTSKNKKNHACGEVIRSEVHWVQTSVTPNPARGDHHCFDVSYDKLGIFSPKGMSGGLIASVSDGEAYRLRVKGMPIEYHKESKTVKCISYKVIANSIQRVAHQQ